MPGFTHLNVGFPMMKKNRLGALLAPLAVAGFVAATTNVGHADTYLGPTIDDPLHGACAGCADNGTNTPLVSQPFSFSVSPGPQTGTLLIEVLEPTAAQVPGVNPIITGTSTNTGAINTTATLLPGEFTMGDLADFVGLPGGAKNTSPANPIGGFGAGGVTSYSVYQANLGTQTLTANGATCNGDKGGGVVSGCNPQLFVSTLPTNSYIVGFLEQTGGNIATALSGALLVPGPVVGAGLPGLIAACGGLLALARRRRHRTV
jgi:hypothetical protein